MVLLLTSIRLGYKTGAVVDDPIFKPTQPRAVRIYFVDPLGQSTVTAITKKL